MATSHPHPTLVQLYGAAVIHHPPRELNACYEAALKLYPWSYKLWFGYLQERMKQLRGRPVNDVAWERVNEVFERALSHMNKMPRIWVEYCQHLLKQYKVTKSRETLDNALRSLPITQHERIWPVYLKFINQKWVPIETAIRCWKRYLQLEPTAVEDYVGFVEERGATTELINGLIRMLNNNDFSSQKGITKHEYWVKLCQLLANQTEDIELEGGLRTETIIRSGITKFPAEVGQLWCCLADFHSRLARFDAARDVYEEGIMTVTTVKDFGQIFDAYTQFEETLLNTRVDMQNKGESMLDVMQSNDICKAILAGTDAAFDDDQEIDFRTERLEHLLDRREELLNSVLLRQNPHNVFEWMRRVNIFKETKPDKVIVVFTEALKTVDPSKAVGKPNMLWVAFAKYYAFDLKRLDLARFMLQKGTDVEFKTVKELAHVWIEWAQLELQHNNPEGALAVLRRATATNMKIGKHSWKDRETSVKERLWQSEKLWQLYAEIDEAVGAASGRPGIESTKAIYERMIDLRVATVQHVLNYANMMQQHKYWEDSFKVYEKGLSLFDWPHVKDIWLQYLKKFLDFYKETKLERARDLFDQCLRDVPQDCALVFFLMQAKMEEQYGSNRKLMEVLDRAATRVSDQEKIKVFRIYLKKAQERFDVTATRSIYQRAVDSLGSKDVPEIALLWCEMEKALGEAARVRALYAWCSQFVNPEDPPESAKEFWEQWSAFEVEEGTQESFTEMLQQKRRVVTLWKVKRST